MRASRTRYHLFAGGIESLRSSNTVYREKGDAASIPFVKRAIELDPNFARLTTLGVRYGNLSQTALLSPT